MADNIILVSDDEDFFEYVKQKIHLRNIDEIFCYSFDDFSKDIFNFSTAVLFVNSENAKDKTIDLLNICSNFIIIVFEINKDEDFKNLCYENGCFEYCTLLMTDNMFNSILKSALKITSTITKNQKYRNILVENKFIDRNNEVYINYNDILDKELVNINKNNNDAIFAAISPNDKDKFLINSNVIESVILNNIRNSDILMNYAANKYFLLMNGINNKVFETIWSKIQSLLPQKFHVGYSCVKGQKREQIINEVLNKLHQAINSEKDFVENNLSKSQKIGIFQDTVSFKNFKQFRQDYARNIEQIINPVFYNIQQKYSSKLYGMQVAIEDSNNGKVFSIVGKKSSCLFKVSSPGFSKINIDITFTKDNESDSKRITIDTQEFEEGLLEDLLEQLVLEYKKGVSV